MATIKTPAAGVSPYQETAAAPVILRADANGNTVLANPNVAVAAATAAATDANANVIVNGSAALNSLIATSRTGVFEGANVTINLEEQNFNTTNQVTSTTNYPSGGIGEIQYNNGANGFSSSAYFTYTNGNVVTPGIRTDGYYYANGSPFSGGGGGGNTFSAITMTSTPGGASNQINYGLGNLFVWNDGGWTIGEYNGNTSGTEGIRINPDIEGPVDVTLPSTQSANTQPTSLSNFLGNVVVNSGNNYVSYQWKFKNDGNLILPDAANVGIKYANGSPYGSGGSYGNANVAVFLGNFGANNISSTGNVTANTFVTPGVSIDSLGQITAASNNVVSLIANGSQGGFLVDYYGNTNADANTSAGEIALNGGANVELTIGLSSDSGNGAASRVWRYNTAGQTSFPILTTQRGDSTSGTITGYTLNGGDGTYEFVISTPNGVTGIDNSQRLVINPGKGADGTSGEGGDIYLWAGRGGSGDLANAIGGGSGGDVKIRGGQGMAGGEGGYIRIEAGDGDNQNSPGGYPGFIEITGGQGGNTAPGGYVRILAGTGDIIGGDANISAGTGLNGPGGNVNITAGGSGNGLAEYGNVNITAGASTWTFDNTGKLTVPGEGYIRAIGDTISVKSYDLANSLGYGLRVGTTGGLYLEQGNAPAYLTFDSNAGNAQIYTASGLSGAAGKNLTIYAGSADESSYNTSTGGNIYLQAGAGGSNDGGGGGPGGSVNISAGASLDPAGHAGNITINTGNNTWKFDYTGNLTTPGVSGNITGADYISANVYTAPGNVSITADGYTWIFEAAGNLTFPTGMHIDDEGANTRISQNSGFLKMTAGNTATYQAGWAEEEGTGQGNVALMIANAPADSLPGNLAIKTGNQSSPATSYYWIFGNDGMLTLPYGTLITDTSDAAIAIGVNAGTGSSSAISIGTGAGNTGQSFDSIAIGGQAGANTQGGTSIAIGSSAGANTQGIGAVAIGSFAGNDSQGDGSIAIGASAGETAQGNNSIILNASGSPLNQTTANTFTVKPVRGDSTANLTSGGFKAVYYNPTTGEFAYSTD